MPSQNNINFTLTAKDLLTPVMRGAQNTMDRFKKDASAGFGMAAGISIWNTAGMAFGIAVEQMKELTRAASDLREQQTKSDAVFKGSASVVRMFAADAARSFGMSERAALQATGTIGNLLEAIGETPQSAARMSVALAKLAADLSSFNNQPTEEVLRALNAALVGEAEPARRLGINISMARVESYAFAHGIAKTGQALTDAQKVMTRYAIIMTDTKNAQGDFARTSGNLANSQRILDAEVENLQASFGQFLMGPGTTIVQWATDLIDMFNGVSAAAKDLQDKVGKDLGTQITLDINAPDPSSLAAFTKSLGWLTSYQDIYGHEHIIDLLPGDKAKIKMKAFAIANAQMFHDIGLSYDDYSKTVMDALEQAGLGLEDIDVILSSIGRIWRESSVSQERNAIVVTQAGYSASTAAMKWAESNTNLAKSGLSAADAIAMFNRKYRELRSGGFSGQGMPIAIPAPSNRELDRRAREAAKRFMDLYVVGLRAESESAQIASIITMSGTSQAAQIEAEISTAQKAGQAALKEWLRLNPWFYSMGENAAEKYVRGFGSSFRSQMRSFKKDVRELMMDIQWEMDHPQAQDRYIVWLEAKLKQTNRVARRARRTGNTQALEDARALREELRTELEKLGALDTSIGISVNATTGAIPPGYMWVPGKGIVRKVRAAGGPVDAGESFLVGERGPEVLQMGSTGGRVIPNHHLGGNIVVNIDGKKLFEIVNQRLGRAVKMGV